jgi:prevent-host-death family protein
MKTKAAELLRTVRENRRPVVITQSGEPKGVLMDFDSYQELRRATLLLRIVAQGETDARDGRAATQGRVFKELRKRLGKP